MQRSVQKTGLPEPLPVALVVSTPCPGSTPPQGLAGHPDLPALHVQCWEEDLAHAVTGVQSQASQQLGHQSH